MINNKHKIVQMYNSKSCEQFEFIGDDEDIGGWPVIGAEAYHGFAGQFVDLATEKSEADPVAVLLTFLTRFGVECGNSAGFMVGECRHPARLFAAIVGNSSKARKGTSGKPVQALFDFTGIEAGIGYDTARHTPGPLSTGEGIIYNVRDPEYGMKEDKRSGEQVEVLVDPGIEDKRLFVFDEEFAGALKCSKREGNTLSATLRNAYDDGTMEPLTKGNRIKATKAHVGIVTHITMRELECSLNETEYFNGFANRFLWVCARRSKLEPFPEPMDQIRLFSLKDELLEILRTAQKRGSLRFSEEAKALWAEVYPDLTKENHGLLGTVINRAEAQAIRLSLTYALLDGTDTIEAVHLRAALTVWCYCEASARFIFGDKESNKFTRGVMAALRDGPKSNSGLYAWFNRKISRRDLQGALKDLISQNKVNSEKVPTGGKPATVYRLVQSVAIGH